MLINDQCNNPDGMAAANASVEYHIRNMRSKTCIRDNVPELITSGTAMRSNSEHDPGFEGVVRNPFIAPSGGGAGLILMRECRVGVYGL